MSKLTHKKAIARSRNRKHNRATCYSKKEMKALMPNFAGKKPVNFKKTWTASIIDNESHTNVYIKIDKNGQIYDCTRIGNVLSRLYGRSPEMVEWDFWMMIELNKTK